MKQKKHLDKKLLVKPKLSKRLSSLSFMPGWLGVTGSGWSLATAVLAVCLLMVLSSTPLDQVPKRAIGRFNDMFSKVTLSSHFQPTTTETAASTPNQVADAKKSANTNVVQPQANNSGSQFSTLAPGSALPSDSDCAARVKPKPEVRPANSSYNNTKGVGGNTEFSRVTGNFTGTTDEILQWAACKWGINEDIVRAQAVKESWWFHRTMGDFATDPALCWPPNNVLGADPAKPGQCPESVGILQVRYQYHNSGLAAGTYSPYYSTAYNADYTYAVWRDCYEGNMTWLNTVEKGALYVAGDEWGCVGEWFSGRWYTPATLPYINAVKDYLNQRTWEHPDFLAAS